MVNYKVMRDQQRNATDNQHKKVYAAGKFQTETKNCMQSCLVLNPTVERKYPSSTNISFSSRCKKIAFKNNNRSILWHLSNLKLKIPSSELSSFHYLVEIIITKSSKTLRLHHSDIRKIFMTRGFHTVQNLLSRKLSIDL